MFKKIDFFINQYKLQQFIKKEYFNYLILTFSLIFGVYINWDLKEILLLVFIVYIFLFLPKSNIIAKGAMFSLVLVPIFLLLRREEWANDFAEIAYILLVFTVLLTLLENKTNKN